MLMLMLAISIVSAQQSSRYFLIDDTKQREFIFNHIKCRDITYQAELFNIFYKDDSNHFTLFSALPDMVKKVTQWKEISLDTIKNNLISTNSLKKQFNEGLIQYINTNGSDQARAAFKSEWIKPIIKINNKYYTPITPTLMEHFQISENNTPFNYLNNIFPNLNQFFEINTDAVIFPLAKFEAFYQDKFKHPSFNSHYDTYDGFNTHYVYNKPIIIRGNNVQIGEKMAYSYWTLASWSIDGKNIERGIDRFNYIPGLGIVSGAFSYHFWWDNKGKINTPPASVLVNNYLENVQLMPYEINSKPFKKYKP